METDKEHKFNFFKKTEKYNNHTSSIIGLGVVICILIIYYSNTPKVIYLSSNTVIPKSATVQGVLTVQNSFSYTAAPTFVINPQNHSFEK